MDPVLSVIIPSFNRPDLLNLCLTSLRGHAPANTEILVVDDGSADAAISETALRFPGVRVIRLPRRSGFCTAANIGIASAASPIIELLNDDTEVTPGWADAALGCFRDPRVVSVAPLVLQLDPIGRAIGLAPLIDSAGDEYDPGGFARKRWHDRRLDDSTELQSHRVWGASATAAFYRRDAIRSAGGFPDDFGAYFEDVDLAHRLNRRGGITLFQPASVVWHRVSASYGRKPSREILVQQSRNEERVFWRNASGTGNLIRNLPRHGTVLIAKAYRRLREGTFAPWLQGRWQAWAGIV